MKSFQHRLKEFLAQLDDMAAKRAEQRDRTAPVRAAIKHAKRLRDQAKYLPLEAYESPDIITKLDDVLGEFLYQSGDTAAVAAMLHPMIIEKSKPIAKRKTMAKKKSAAEKKPTDTKKATAKKRAAAKKKAILRARVKTAKRLEKELGALGWLHQNRAPNFGGVRTDVLHKFLITEYLRLHPATEGKATLNENTGKYRGDFAQFIYELVEIEELGKKDSQSVLRHQWKSKMRKP